MQLFYTGAGAPNKPQVNPDLSLGGYNSSTVIRNNTLNNVLPTISRSTVVNNAQDTRMIVLKNTTGSAITNIRISLNNTIYCSYQLAAVSPATQGANLIFELLPSSDSLPYQATLAEHQEDAPITVASLAANAMIGIWISRTLNLDAFTGLDGTNETITPTEVIAILQDPSPAPSTDSAALVITW